MEANIWGCNRNTNSRPICIWNPNKNARVFSRDYYGGVKKCGTHIPTTILVRLCVECAVRMGLKW